MTPQEALHEISIKAHQYTDDIKMIISKDCYKEIVNALEKQITEKFNCQQTVYADLSKIIKEQAVEIKRLTAFKSYFDELYGKGLDIANWHKNGDLEPFDSFYNSALEEMAGE